MMNSIRLLCFFMLTISLVDAQVNPPCGLDYGSNSDENNIIAQMRYGSVLDAQNAINQAKNTRGNGLGCPQLALTYASPDTTVPSLNDIVTIWNSNHAPLISSFSVNCPRIGRYESNAALGAYYAMLAGYFYDTMKLAEIADMMYDQQYATWNISNPGSRNEGVYAYLNVPSSNSCYIGGVVGSSVTTLCGTLPQYCLNYSSGQFSGSNFAVSAQDDANNWYDGGMAYDHGWVSIQMIESAIQQNDPILKQKYRNSTVLAGQYAQSEHCVKNHNYTAKLIWTLAELYAWTGDSIYKNELLYKLNKNLIPGILWDANNDGFVDGTNPLVSFDSLTATAQTPGRMWDGHNALPWYHAMNAWALTEAYVAFRDRGDFAQANTLKPYVLAMLDNLSTEILEQGVLTPNPLGARDICYALLIGLWKLADYENEAHLNWEKAAWAMWNSGYFNNYNTHSVCVGLYLLLKSGTSYQTLDSRENFVLATNDLAKEPNVFKAFPNPVTNEFTLELAEENNYIWQLQSLSGGLVLEGEFNGNVLNVSLSSLSSTVYVLMVRDRSKVVCRQKIIKK